MNQTSLIFFNPLPPLDGLPSHFILLTEWLEKANQKPWQGQGSKNKKKGLNEKNIFLVDHGSAGCTLHVHGVNWLFKLISKKEG